MLTIRNAQMRALRAHREADFRARLQALLCSGFSLEPEVAEAESEAAMTFCLDCGLTRECDIAGVATIVADHLGGFRAGAIPPPGRYHLYQPGASPDERLMNFAEWCRLHPRHAGASGL